MDIRYARLSEEAECVNLVQSAFRNDPFFVLGTRKGMPDDAFYADVIRAWVHESFCRGIVQVARRSGHIEGIAVLGVPYADEIPYTDDRTRQINPAKAAEFEELCEQSDEACKSETEPHWHLVMLAAEPPGRGTGSGLLTNAVFGHVHSHGGGVLTLATNTERNCRFYEQHGFELFDRRMLDAGGETLANWSFRRPSE